MNLGSLIEESIRKFGEYDNYYFEGKWWTNVEVNKASNQLGNALKKLGITKGDRVVTQLPNCIEIFTTFTAVYKIGAVILPMNPMLRPEQISYIYKDSGARATVTTSDYLPWIREAQKTAPDLKYIILIDKDGVEGTLYWPKLLAENSDELEMLEMDGDDLAALIYTSGTTGNPKGVMHTHNSLWINAMAYNDFIVTAVPTTVRAYGRSLNNAKFEFEEHLEEVTGFDRNNPYLATLPLSHSFGIVFMNLGMLAGYRNIIMKWWNPEEALKLIQKFRISFVTLVPTMYVHLLDHPDFAKYDISSLRFCASGAAALDPEISLKWTEKTGKYIIEGWGMTESGATTSGCSPAYLPKIGSIGKSMLKCNRISVVDGDDKEIAHGQMGELVIKGPTLMKGYWHMPDETKEAMKNGWLHTGDIGYRDAEGNFYITDRKKDLIIRGGENVSPKEIEEVICRHDKVLEAACIGIKDRVYGEEIKAFVVLKPGEKCSEEEMIEHCSKALPSFKRPKKVQFIEALPKNMMGKVLRAELRKVG
jgi:long-chain acyl-CoA synthetase